MGWSAFRRTGLTGHNPNLSVKGYTIFAPLGGDSLYLIDIAGRIVRHWQFDDFEPDMGQFTTRGTLLVCGTDVETRKRARSSDEDRFDDFNLHLTRLGGGYTTLREYDFAGNLLWSYDNPAMHHDFLLTADDHFLVPIWRTLPDDFAASIDGGRMGEDENPHGMVGDDIIEIDREGNELNRWHTWQMFDPVEDAIRPLQGRLEWTHINSINLTENGKLIISCRNNSRVAVIDREEHEIVWKLGSPVVSLQHHATAVHGGNIQIFDNGMNRPGSLAYSRVIEVDPALGETRIGDEESIVWQYKARPLQQFYSGHISSAQRLAMGSVLICEGVPGRLFEVTRQGEIVWEWINPFVTGSPDGSLRTWIYRAYRYEQDHPAFANKNLDPEAYRQVNAQLGLI